MNYFISVIYSSIQALYALLLTIGYFLIFKVCTLALALAPMYCYLGDAQYACCWEHFNDV